MLFIGVFTAFAGLNTFEVVAKKDVPISSVITDVQLTSDAQANALFAANLKNTYPHGSFGVPKKIKLPEANRHVDIIDAIYDKTDGWKGSQGLAHRILLDKPRQKVFGQSLVYMRVGTATTQKMGNVYEGDVINIVTTEGWQLGYTVSSVSYSAKSMLDDNSKLNSKLLVVLIDEQGGPTRYIAGFLEKVGERI